MSTYSFVYVGPAALAGLLAQELRQNGLTSTYEPPVEVRDASQAIEVVRILFEVAADGWLVHEIAEKVQEAGRRHRKRFSIQSVPAARDLQGWWETLDAPDRERWFVFARSGWGLEVPDEIVELVGRKSPPLGIAYGLSPDRRSGRLMLLDNLTRFVDERLHEAEEDV